MYDAIKETEIVLHWRLVWML